MLLEIALLHRWETCTLFSGPYLGVWQGAALVKQVGGTVYALRT